MARTPADPEALRRHHRELFARLEDGLKELAERGDQGHVILGSLGEDLVRYMRASEGSLYPAWPRWSVSDAEIVAPMMLDAFRSWTVLRRTPARGGRGMAIEDASLAPLEEGEVPRTP